MPACAHPASGHFPPVRIHIFFYFFCFIHSQEPAQSDGADKPDDDTTPVRIHVPEACMERGRSRGVLPGDEKVKPWINKSKERSAARDGEVGAPV
jgi:hypothetical protein